MKLFVSKKEQRVINRECQQRTPWGAIRIDECKKKGKYIELLVKKVFLNLGKQVVEINDDDLNISDGDLIIIDNNKHYNCECKSSHVYEADKLAFDVKLIECFKRNADGTFKKDIDGDKILLQKNERCKTPYIQGSTGNDLGWLYNENYDYICAINLKSNRCYIIYEAQKLMEQLRDLVDLQVYVFSSWEEWYKNGNNNKLHEYVEGSIKRDSTKESYIINLELSEESFKCFDIKYDIINLEIEIEGKKPENEKTPNDIASIKRRSIR